jgi:hypothetical protein
MYYPTFWFSNSGITWDIIKEKICCCKQTLPNNQLDYEWDIHDGYRLTIGNAQPVCANKL